MKRQLFTGNLVRLVAANPESDPETLATWSRNAGFLRLMDTDPAQPWSLARVREDMKRFESKGDMFAFHVRTLAEDKLIGFVSLSGPAWTHSTVWFGIGIGDDAYWGKGYGTDAVRLAVQYAFEELNMHRVTLNVFDYNVRAVRSYEKVGFVLEGRQREAMQRDGKRIDILYMGILREEWVATTRAEGED